MNTLEQARGRWRDILLAHGIGSEFLTNKHGPCPMCGGKDRFRWDNKDGAGTYYCNQCGAGDGLTLLRKFHNWDFKTAVDEIDKVLGRAKYVAPKTVATTNDRNRIEIEKALAEATRPEIVAGYLKKRGLSVVPSILKGHPSLQFFDENHRPAGRFPAVVCPVLGPDGNLQSAHRIYLSDTIPKGQSKKLMAPVETVKGGAARLFPHNGTLGIGEGVETCIAASELFGVPVWAGITAGGVEWFVPPAGVKRLIVFSDNDENFAGQKAAYALANRLSVSRGRTIERIEVKVPPRPDTDWLDVLKAGRA